MNKEKSFITVSVPAELIKTIDERAVGKHGYRSRADVVCDALRRLLEQLEQMEAFGKKGGHR